MYLGKWKKEHLHSSYVFPYFFHFGGKHEKGTSSFPFFAFIIFNFYGGNTENDTSHFPIIVSLRVSFWGTKRVTEHLSSQWDFNNFLPVEGDPDQKHIFFQKQHIDFPMRGWDLQKGTYNYDVFAPLLITTFMGDNGHMQISFSCYLFSSSYIF